MKQHQKLFLYNLITKILPNHTAMMWFRIRMLRWCGISIADSVRIMSAAVVRGDGQIVISDHAVIENEVVICCEETGRIEIGEKTYVAQGVYLSAGNGLLRIRGNGQIGNKSLVQAHNANVDIGRYVQVAHFCSIKTSHHKIDVNGPCIGGVAEYNDIVIGEGTWMCAGCIVIPGVKVGRKNVLAAGAVVTKSTEDGVLMAGVPAVVKKRYFR